MATVTVVINVGRPLWGLTSSVASRAFWRSSSATVVVRPLWLPSSAGVFFSANDDLALSVVDIDPHCISPDTISHHCDVAVCVLGAGENEFDETRARARGTTLWGYWQASARCGDNFWRMSASTMSGHCDNARGSPAPCNNAAMLAGSQNSATVP